MPRTILVACLKIFSRQTYEGLDSDTNSLSNMEATMMDQVVKARFQLCEFFLRTFTDHLQSHLLSL